MPWAEATTIAQRPHECCTDVITTLFLSGVHNLHGARRYEWSIDLFVDLISPALVAKALQSSMSKAQLPADIWLEISESYLEQIDIVQLSETCKYLRLCVQPHLFRRLSLVGFVGRRQCPQECIATLLLVERRIQKFLATTHLLQCIHEVEIWNWMGCPLKPSIPVCPVSTEDCDHIPHKKAYVCEYVHLGKSDTCLVAEQELVDLWRNVYGILSDFIASLPELRKVTITECLHSKYDHRAFPVMDLQCLMRRVQAVNCLSFEYSISGTLGPFILPVPNTFGRYSTDLGHTTILDSYFFEVPNANKHPITAARVSLRFLSLLMAQLECKASSILRLGIVINSRCPTTEGKRTLQELILEICPRLTSLEIWNLCEDKCCWPFLSAGDRSLEVVTGSPGVIASILHLDSINAVRIIEINPDRLIQRFQSLTIVAKTVRSLDVSGLHFWNSQLIVQLAVTMPNVQYLTISWMADLTVADLEVSQTSAVALEEILTDVPT